MYAIVERSVSTSPEATSGSVSSTRLTRSVQSRTTRARSASTSAGVVALARTIVGPGS
jgi:hypothetical protein